MNNNEVVNTNARRGQGNWVVSLGAFLVVAYGGYKNPNNLPLPDPLIDALKEPVSVAAQHAKKDIGCMMVNVGLAPKTWCEPQLK